MVLLSTRKLDEGISGKVISGIGGSFRRNTHHANIKSNEHKFYIRIMSAMAIYNHCDPLEKQLPLPIKQRDLSSETPFVSNPIERQAVIPMADGGHVILALHTDSPHLVKFFELNWPANTFSRQPDATIVAMKEDAAAYGLEPGFDGARWFCPKTNQVWMFGNEFYGNVKITVRGLCSEVTPFEQMFVHGCAMAIDGRGVVLSGVSGAGKTTLTAALRKTLGLRLRIVNDDFGPLSLSSGQLKFTGELYLHMKYPSVRALAPGLEVSPASYVTENFQGDTGDPRARLLIAPKQVFGDDGLQSKVRMNMFMVTVRDSEMPAGVRPFTLQDMPLLETGRYSKFYDKTERFLNGSLFITDEARKKREHDRHNMLVENFRCYLVNNVATPEETAEFILAELEKCAPLEVGG